MTTRAPFLMTVTALLLAACAMALGGTEAGAPLRAAVVGESRARPFACVLLAQGASGVTRLEGRITARERLSAAFRLQVHGAGLSIEQSGDLSLAAGQSAVLGEASVPAPLAEIDARLAITVNGRTIACPLERS